MTNVASTSRWARPTLYTSALTAVLALGLTSCSSAGSAEPDAAPSSSATVAKKAESALNAGLEAQTSGDLTAAVAHYEETLEIDADNEFAFYNLALIDEANSNYGLAEQNYRKALEADPSYQPALFNLAILVTSSDPEEAISLYQRAVKADRKDAAAWLNLGLLLRAEGDPAAGNEAVTKAVKLNPDLVDPAGDVEG